MSYKYITTELKERIFEITLNRPEKRNALNGEVVQELKEAFILANDDAAVRVVILKANGKVFSAGADLEYLQQLQKNTYDENLADSSSLKELFDLIYRHKKVIIAEVKGHAIAGGCGLATVCDFVFSVPEAMYGYTEVKIGFIPAIVMFYLIRKIGEGKARELLLTGELIPAGEALEKGLINRVVSSDKIEEVVSVFAAKIASETSPESIARTREMIAEIQDLPAATALNYAAKNNAEARASDDCRKGISAFLDKQELKW